jgi:hypothetical protein
MIVLRDGRTPQEHPPFGSYQGVEPSELARIQSSTGVNVHPSAIEHAPLVPPGTFPRTTLKAARVVDER